MSIVGTIMKELEEYAEDETVKDLLVKIEKSLHEYEEAIMESKACKFTWNRLDYQYGHIYKFDKKLKQLRINEKIDNPIYEKVSKSGGRSDAGTSADETPMEQMDFHKELCLLRKTT
ncbi:hypothetical protein NDU88_001873 [Pleurodeles waltl]|uniref:Uncharacterized protein n=1 Tax=Pleurodeles waltl TaxID=8319 RepID=A0AAV7W1K2_PLEWA|nr:hypothetical protein NDU88_001873 [Pleurodeles waltl]